MFEIPFVGALGLGMGFGLGAIYGRSRAITGFWDRIESRMRELNDSHGIRVRKPDGTELTLEAFVEELRH